MQRERARERERQRQRERERLQRSGERGKRQVVIDTRQLHARHAECAMQFHVVMEDTR